MVPHDKGSTCRILALNDAVEIENRGEACEYTPGMSIGLDADAYVECRPEDEATLSVYVLNTGEYTLYVMPQTEADCGGCWKDEQTAFDLLDPGRHAGYRLDYEGAPHQLVIQGHPGETTNRYNPRCGDPHAHPSALWARVAHMERTLIERADADHAADDALGGRLRELREDAERQDCAEAAELAEHLDKLAVRLGIEEARR